MAVIGSGAAGLITAYIGSVLKAKVALIEKDKPGGDCLNTGCVPSKAMIRSAKLFDLAKNSKHFGIKEMKVDYEFSDIMERIRNIIKKIAVHDSRDRYTSLGVDCIAGEATIVSPWESRGLGEDNHGQKYCCCNRGRAFNSIHSGD